MKPQKPRRVVPKPGGVIYQVIEAGPPIYRTPIVGTPTRMKFDRDKGVFVVDLAYQPKPESAPQAEGAQQASE